MMRDGFIKVAKAIGKGTWNVLDIILEEIPQKSLTVSILKEIKKTADEVIAAGKNKYDVEKAVMNVVEKNGGEAEIEKAVKAELNELKGNNPTFINCAVFMVKQGEALAARDHYVIYKAIKEDAPFEDEELNEFFAEFASKYFGGDIDMCDNACELDAKYVAFNFDSYADIPYSDEYLELVCSNFNRVVGRDVFDSYIGGGTDDPTGF